MVQHTPNLRCAFWGRDVLLQAWEFLGNVLFLGCAHDLGQIARKITRFGATKLWPCGLRAGGVGGLVWVLFLPFGFLHFLVAVVVLSTQNQTDLVTTQYGALSARRVSLPSVGRSSAVLHRLAHRLLQCRSSARMRLPSGVSFFCETFCVSLVDLSEHVACVAFKPSSFTTVVFKSSFCDCQAQKLGATRSTGADRCAHLLGSGLFLVFFFFGLQDSCPFLSSMKAC